MADTYIFLIHEPDWDSDSWLATSARTSDVDAAADSKFPEHKAYQDAVDTLGARLVEGRALQNTRHGGTVTPGGNGRKVEDAVYTDGPFTDTSEVITGFYMVETDDEDTARRLAAMVPTGGHIEWRKIAPMGG